MAADNRYDVFLSYHWRDRVEVEALAHRLRGLDLNVFVDCWYLRPGRSWPQELEQYLRDSRAVAVVIGAGEMGTWQLREMNFALDRQAHEANFPVIPVLLPGAEPSLSFLGQNTWIDLRANTGDEVGLATLAAAIEGEPPGPDIRRQLEQTLASICPYRGLLYFREEDAPFYFGRDAAVAQLTQTVRARHLVAVVGASGCGKSSLVRAGLVPVLREDRNQVWEILTLVPGDRPLRALAASLAPLLEPMMTEADRLIEVNKLARALREGDLVLRDIAERVLARQTGTERLLLVVDQWEELYTLTAEEAVRRRFIDHLLDASRAGSLSLVLTLRGDFVGRALAYRPFSDRLQDGLVNLGPMTRAELHQAVEEPARKVALRFETGLVPRILDDAGDEPGNLPLMEFVLKGLWERRHGGGLLHEAYDAIGQLQGAVAQKADEIVRSLSLLEQQAVRRIFLHLAQPGEGEEYTRRRATLAEIGPASLPLAKRLADERLLVTSPVRDRNEATVEVSHEALIHNWGQLKGWLDEDRQFLLWRRRFGELVSAWRSDRQEGTLLGGAFLAEAQRWLAERPEALSQEERDYISESGECRDREHRRDLEQARALAESQRHRADEQAAARIRQRRSIWALVALVVLAVGTALYGWQQRRVAEQQRQMAERQGQLALSRQLAVQADSQIGRNPQLAFLFAVAARRTLPTDEARESLQRVLATRPSRLRTFLSRHQGEVYSVAFSPDGRTIASAGQDRTVILWDIERRAPLGERLDGHQGSVWGVAFSPDGRTLASAGGDGTVILWDVARRTPLGEPLRGHRGPVSSVAFSRDGRTLASAGGDGAVILWDVARRTPLGEPLRGYRGAIESVAFGPDGRTLASAGHDGTVTIWDVARQTPLGEPLRGHQGRVFSVAFSLDGRTLASAGGDGTVILWDVARRTPFGEPLGGHQGRVFSVAFSLDGRTLASTGEDRAVILWDVAHRTPLGEPLRAHQDWVLSVAFSPDGRTLASAGDDGMVTVWDVVPRTLLGEPLMERQDWMSSVAFSSDGRTFASAGDDGTVTLWDVARRAPLGEPLRGHQARVSSVAFSPDSRTLASAGADGTVVLWDVARRSPSGEPLRGHQGMTSSVAFSPDGRTLASAGGDGTVILWDVARRMPLGEPLRKHQGVVSSVAFSPDGRTLASAGMDGTVILWEVAHRTPLGELLRGHQGGVSSVAFSPDGRTLASAGQDGGVILWDVARRIQLGEQLKGHKGGVRSVAFSPDGRTIGSAGQDQTVILWDVDIDSWIRRACAIANRNLTRREWARYVGADVQYLASCPELPVPTD